MQGEEDEPDPQKRMLNLRICALAVDLHEVKGSRQQLQERVGTSCEGPMGCAWYALYQLS